jgi:hypothetical protein
MGVVLGALPLLTASTVYAAASASANTNSCAPAGGFGGISVSGCILVSPSTKAFQGNAHITAPAEGYIAIAQVTQICSGTGTRCSNLANTLMYDQYLHLFPGDNTLFGKLNQNSFGHTYRGCVMWRLPSGQSGGTCSPARSL